MAPLEAPIAVSRAIADFVDGFGATRDE
jgi:hypothetical protein